MLFKYQSENRHLIVALLEAKVAVVLDHDLAREAQAYAGAIGLGGVERHKDLFDLMQRNGFAVVGQADDGLVLRVEVGGDADGVSVSLYCVLNQVVENEHHLALVDVDEQVGRFGRIGDGGSLLGGFGLVEKQHALHHLVDHHGLADGRRHLREVAIRLNEANQVLR